MGRGGRAGGGGVGRVSNTFPLSVVQIVGRNISNLSGAIIKKIGLEI